ncbi:flavin monoamine oxidase family protein, partial [Leucobacter soli]|uniref:flavin monoamine oxidase family protein n=1 Tax=Leucobacter soli TaxID=2812850 RepID=UPI00361B1AC9
ICVREFLRHRSEEQYGADARDLDALGLDDVAVEGDEVVFPEGYDRLPARLAEGLDVRLEHVVSCVRWSGAGDGGAGDSDGGGADAAADAGTGTGAGVSVETDRGAFEADRVLVTVPVGVLRSDDFVFEPPLPEPVAGALARFEMNAFEKVFLRFPEKFWAEGVYAFRRQGPAAEWWHSWYDLTPLHGTPTLLTFAAGACAREIRGWSDERIADSVLEALREIYGPDIPEPEHVRVTRWQDDAYAHGSYAYMTVGAVPEDHEVLATPLGESRGGAFGGALGGGVLHLAGEATWQEDPATVTAALCSGHRAAERILGDPLPIDRIWA